MFKQAPELGIINRKMLYYKEDLYSSLFILGGNQVKVFILIYVDDILLTSPDIDYIHNLIATLNYQFSLKDLGDLSFLLGIKVHINSHGMHLCQAKYAKELLVKIHMQDAKACKSPMATRVRLFVGDNEPYEDPTQYRSTIGALQYL